MLSLDSKLVNSLDGGPLPLHMLAEFAITLRGGENEKQNAIKCLEHLLHADPDPTADFFTALHSLPRWLSEKAVIMAPVQELLNEKNSQRFPTLLAMIEFFALMVVIVTYSTNAVQYITLGRDFNRIHLIPLYLGVAFFILREIIQIRSLFSIKSFRSVLFNPFYWINFSFCGLVLCWTIIMTITTSNDDSFKTGYKYDDLFRTGTAFTCIILCFKVLAFLRNMSIDFAVFMAGVVFVVKRLIPFYICLACILGEFVAYSYFNSLFLLPKLLTQKVSSQNTVVAFAQMFLTVFQGTSHCQDSGNNSTETQWCEKEGEAYQAFCAWVPALLALYSMLLGEVDERMFEESTIAVWLFAGFMFLVVILLANVLIAIVTDSYKIVQDQRAAIVFWTNRLDKVAEMNAFANAVGLGSTEQNDAGAVNFSGKDFWKRLIDLFDENEEDYTWLELWMNVMPQRMVAAICIIPLWLVLGFFTAGWLWPPQVREFIFTSTVSRHSSDSEKEDELRKTQVVLLQKEVKQLSEVFAEELVIERTQVVQMKSQVDQKIIEIESELKSILRLMQMLFQQQTSVT